VSASGTTPYTLAVARTARSAGAAVIGIANVPGAPLLVEATHPVLVETGAEVIAGSTRLGAATAQKVALNMLSVLMAIRMGAVHDGHMVDVVADNAKLRDRAARIVAAIAGTDEDRARAALTATGGVVKTAVLVARGLTPQGALQALEQSGGHLAPHLEH
jgi:N-acetylmuramic acid 6-phosphate etherase